MYPITYPRRVGRTSWQKRHVGLYYYSAYWRHWDKVLAVDGLVVTVQTVTDEGLPVEEPRRHCTPPEAAMFADRPFPVTYRM